MRCRCAGRRWVRCLAKKEGNSLEAAGGQVGNDMPETEH